MLSACQNTNNPISVENRPPPPGSARFKHLLSLRAPCALHDPQYSRPVAPINCQRCSLKKHNCKQTFQEVDKCFPGVWVAPIVAARCSFCSVGPQNDAVGGKPSNPPNTFGTSTETITLGAPSEAPNLFKPLVQYLGLGIGEWMCLFIDQ